MRININLDPKAFNEVYWDNLFDYRYKLEIFYGGAGSGKSYHITQKILLKALKSKRKVLIIRKTLASQRDSCWRLFLDTLIKWGLHEHCAINKTECTIQLPNGSVLLFKGLDDPEKIKSIVGLTDIWAEEATELTEDDFDQLRLRLRAKAANLQFFVSFNPVSKAHFLFKRYFAPDAMVGEDVYILKTTYKDNKFLPKEYVESIESLVQTNPIYHKIYALGEFSSLNKLVYNNWQVEDFDFKDLKGSLCVGLDFGFVNDKTALICSILQGNDLYIFKEYTCINKTNDEIYNVIKMMGLHKSVIIADSAEPKSIEELRKFGCTRIRESKKGPDSIMHGIQKLQQFKIHVHYECEETITEFENYAWQKDKRSNEYLNKPIDDYNHCLDALRYSLQCIETRKLKTTSKTAIGF